MMINPGKLVAGALAAMLAGGVALADDKKGWTADLREVPITSDVTYEGKSVSDLKNMVVVNRQGEQLGIVKHVLVDHKNQPSALAVDVDDSLSGSVEVILKLDDASIDGGGNQVVVSYNSAALRALPRWRSVP